MTVANLIRAAVDGSPKTQKHIAKEAGFRNANVISMLKSGNTRVPIAKAPALARSLGLNPAELMRACLSEYHPDYLEALCDSFHMDMTDDEHKFINELRRVSGPCHVVALTDTSRRHLDESLASLRTELPTRHQYKSDLSPKPQ